MLCINMCVLYYCGDLDLLDVLAVLGVAGLRGGLQVVLERVERVGEQLDLGLEVGLLDLEGLRSFFEFANTYCGMLLHRLITVYMTLYV